jgi:hypothetical protein
MLVERPDNVTIALAQVFQPRMPIAIGGSASWRVTEPDSWSLCSCLSFLPVAANTIPRFNLLDS